MMSRSCIESWHMFIGSYKNNKEQTTNQKISSEESLQPKSNEQKNFWIKLSQRGEEDELTRSVSNGEDNVQGKYRRLAVYKDEENIWRVGSRLKEYTPFTSHKNGIHS